LTVVNQIIEDKLGQPVRVMLASLRQGDDLVDDDFRHRVVNVTLEQERVAGLLKRRAHSLNVRRVDLVFRERHRCSLSGRRRPT
jgi:hypothetical protein